MSLYDKKLALWSAASALHCAEREFIGYKHCGGAVGTDFYWTLLDEAEKARESLEQAAIEFAAAKKEHENEG